MTPLQENSAAAAEGPATERDAHRRNFAFVTRLIPGVQAAADSAALLGAGYGCYFGLVVYSFRTVDYYNVAILFNWLATVLIFHYAGLYQFGAILRPRQSMDRMAIAIITAFMLMLAAAFSLKISETYSRVWIASFFLASFAAVTVARFAVAMTARSLAKAHVIARRTVVYGRMAQISQFMQFAETADNEFLNVVAVFVEPGEQAENSKFSSLVRGDFESLVSFVRTDAADDIILAMPWSEVARIQQLLSDLREIPINILLGADLAGYKLHMGEPPSYFESTPLFQLAGKPLSGWDVVIKTIMDYAIALLLLALLSPVLLLTAILIKLDSPGPILFRQQRLGFNNRVFDIYKFRSMTHIETPDARTVQAQAGDTRITRVGRFIRKSSIDELPQLLNVLNGSMSLVGPRPHAVDHNEDYARKIRGYFARHRVKPGITGLAQVKGYRGLTDTLDKMEQRVKYDLEYTETWSPLLDIKILLLTPFAVAGGKNAI